LTAQVGTQRMPMGVVAQVHPRAPGAQAFVHSDGVVHARGPIAPASATGVTPASPAGIIIPRANEASGVAWKHRGMYGNVLVST
jgi:hypothetical protein